MNVKKDEIIFKQGEKASTAYFIESGQVEIFYTNKNNLDTHLTILGHGEIFGEMALIDANVRSASARALTEVKLHEIQKDQLLDKINASSSLVQMIVKVLMERIRKINQTEGGDSYYENKITYGAGSETLEKIKYENQIFEASKNKEFVLYHQPIFDLKTKKIVGSEALIRWNKPQHGMINPGQFIDILENSSMIVPVGYWVIEQCFEDYKNIQKQKIQPFSISINVSGRQFLHHEFISTVKKLIQKHQINPKNFKIEIIERVMMETALLTSILKQLRELGFEISLDDFGTGFSSLQYLADMPIDYLKIDRSFVVNLFKDQKTKAVVKSILYLAKQLGLKVITEGIETPAEAELMTELGSDYGQGFLFSKPLSFDELLKLL
jgi:EAL domain-containing protein (putative c-di-GMP-specific phosphodiesterase class I)